MKVKVTHGPWLGFSYLKEDVDYYAAKVHHLTVGWFIVTVTLGCTVEQYENSLFMDSLAKTFPEPERKKIVLPLNKNGLIEGKDKKKSKKIVKKVMGKKNGKKK